jgi:AcrR family transcriptional regulator
MLDATLEELGRRGYADLSVEDVAQRAGVNKTSVYRRWPTKSELVRAALLALRAQHGAPPDTGTLRGDLVELLRRARAKLSAPRGSSVFRALMAERDALARKMREQQHAEDAPVFERAVARGELSAATDTRFLLDLLTAPLLRRIFIARDKVDDEYLVRVVDVVLHGVMVKPAAVRRAKRN